MSTAALIVPGLLLALLALPDLPAVWRRLRRSAQQAAERRRALRLLHDMDDRMLKDIGIGRSQIPGVVGAWPVDTRHDRPR